MPRTDQHHSDYALALIGRVLRKSDIELKGTFWREHRTTIFLQRPTTQMKLIAYVMDGHEIDI
jgi:hypothetical protein